MKAVGKIVLLYESIGFGAIILLLWTNEVFDLPYVLFGAPATPINWVECVEETICVLLLAVVIMSLTRNNINKIKYLEGFLPVCSFCKRIRVNDRWIPIEVYISDHSEAVFSHGYCPECAQKYIMDDLDSNPS